MATIRQKKLAKAIVENLENPEPKTKGELLESVGYSPDTAKAKPGEIIEQKGVQEELIRLGFTEDNAKSVVAEILNNPSVDPNSRLKAADMTFKVHGSYAPEKSVQVQVKGEVKDFAKYQKVKEKYEAELLTIITD